MEVQLYKKIEAIVKNLSNLEDQQNKKLDQILAQLAEIKQLLTVAPKADKPKVQESKVKK